MPQNSDELVKHYPLYHTALRVKLESAKEGSGTRSQASIIDIGRRLSAIDFVVMLLACRDITKGITNPLNMQAQAREEGPELERKMKQCVARLQTVPTALHDVRKWLWITVLLWTHVQPSVIRSLWRALSYKAAWRPLQGLVAAIPDLLLHCSFQGCRLHEQHHHAAGIDSSAHQLLAARCQCDTQTVRRNHAGRRERIQFRYRGRLVRVLAPQYVSRGEHVPAAHTHRLKAGDFSWLERLPAIRYSAAPYARNQVPFAQGEVRFLGVRGQHQRAGAEHTPACVIKQHFLLNALIDINAGIQEAEKFTTNLSNEYSSYFGDVGVNLDTQRMNEAGAIAFDWAFLAKNPPQIDHVRAFDTLREALEPVLRRGKVPVGLDYVSADSRPSARQYNRQYVLLCKRIRVREQRASMFSRVTSIFVSSLRVKFTKWSLLFRQQKIE